MGERMMLRAALPLTLLLAGCEPVSSKLGLAEPFKEEYRSVHPLPASRAITVESFQGAIEVLGGNAGEVEVAGTKHAASEDQLKAIRIEVDAAGGTLRIRAQHPEKTTCRCGASFKLRVPKQVRLEAVETSNGSIRVEGTEGPASLKTSNGTIKVLRVTGDVKAKTSNAEIELLESRGAMAAETSNGRIRAEGVGGSFDGQTSNSSIDVTMTELKAGQPVRAVSSNGSLNLRFDQWKDNSLRAATSNGSINLWLPVGVNAELRAATSNGNITSSYEVAGSQRGKTRLSGRIGSGGPLLDLSTSNGNIRIAQR